MNVERKLEEVCEMLAKEKYRAHMSGSNQFDYDSETIAFIYDINSDYVEYLVRDKFADLVIGK